MPEDPAAKAVRILRQTAVELNGASAAAIRAAAQEMKNAILSEARQAVPGARLSHVGKSGVRLGVGYEITGTRAIVKARGPWGLVESKIKAHWIGPRRRRGVRASLKFPDGGIRRGPVWHKGVAKGRQPQPWDKGVAKATPKATKILAERYIKAAARAW